MHKKNSQARGYLVVNHLRQGAFQNHTENKAINLLFVSMNLLPSQLLARSAVHSVHTQLILNLRVTLDIRRHLLALFKVFY